MPELPEVETVRRGLEPILVGRRIHRVEQRRPDLRWPLPRGFARRLTGRRVTALSRRGKFLLAALDNEWTLLAHLGMSGRFLILEGRAPRANSRGADDPEVRLTQGDGPHDHVVFALAARPQQPAARIVFRDPRRFGMMDLVKTARCEQHQLLHGMGPEPLSENFSIDWFQARLAGRTAPIKNLLLDQRIVAGIGNIYASESLYRAGIAPHRAGGRIAAKRIPRLMDSIRTVLEESIAAGGSSLRDFRGADGELGYFQRNFAVYDREGEPCQRSGCSGTVRCQTHSGRSTYWCPKCQA